MSETEFSKDRAHELRDALNQEIIKALEGGVLLTEVWVCLGFLLEMNIELLPSGDARRYAIEKTIEHIQAIDIDRDYG